MPQVGIQDQFEQNYISRLKSELSPHGQMLQYDYDRAALDLGLHLYDKTITSKLVVGQVRVWFQAKGVQISTLDETALQDAGYASVTHIRIDHINYWYAHPEPVYLVLYIEALDCFLAEDIRILVESQGGPRWLSELRGQETTTLRIPLSCTLRRAIAQMPRHRSLRLDGGTFRGRPLGHRLDPLRSELDRLAPETFSALVDQILAAHQFKITRKVALEHTLGTNIGRIDASIGRLYLTYEWTTPLATEFGFDPDSDFRLEAAPMHAHGDVLVVIHSEVISAPRATAETGRLISSVQREGIEQALVFFNASEGDPSFFGGWRVALQPLVRAPQGLGSLAFNALTTTTVYLDFVDRLTWRLVNYLDG